MSRVIASERRIVALTAGSLRPRTLALLADELVGEDSRGPGLRLTQGKLGALLGAARQSVNPALGSLAKDGLIRQRYEEIAIVDAERILELAGEDAFLRKVC